MNIENYKQTNVWPINIVFGASDGDNKQGGYTKQRHNIMHNYGIMWKTLIIFHLFQKKEI